MTLNGHFSRPAETDPYARIYKNIHPCLEPWACQATLPTLACSKSVNRSLVKLLLCLEQLVLLEALLDKLASSKDAVSLDLPVQMPSANG